MSQFPASRAITGQSVEAGFLDRIVGYAPTLPARVQIFNHSSIVPIST
jgi:hypothetical protein